MSVCYNTPTVKRGFGYIGEVRAELGKIIWPKRDEVVRLTFIVIAISAIVAAYVGALDFIFVKLLEALVSL